MSQNLLLKFEAASQSIIFDTLPVGNGVNRNPKSLLVAPFRLCCKPKGLFYQATTQEKLSKLIDYSHESYQHATPTPSATTMQKNRAMSFLKHIEKFCGGVFGKRILEIGAGSTFIGEYFTEQAGAASFMTFHPSMFSRLYFEIRCFLIEKQGFPEDQIFTAT